jgi:hypothetical protein
MSLSGRVGEHLENALETGQKKASSTVVLGISAKSSSIVDFKGKNFDPETGEIFLEKVDFDPVQVRLERFALQSASRRILRYSPVSRVARCLRARRFDKSQIEVLKSKEHSSAHYGGLQTCASVWTCPVCAAKISERRRMELLNAIAQHQKSGGQVLLLTLTNPHTASDCLQATLKAQALAMSRFNSNRSSKALFDGIGCIGTVRAWEVTHGVNGWHPHFHILLFVSPGPYQVDYRHLFYLAWANACRLAGLPMPSEAHGVSLDDGSRAAEYASKWGLDQEMTKGHIKKAHKGATPFDFLRSYLRCDTDRLQAFAAARFLEYAKAFKGRRQLVWSMGLKALFDLGEVTDEEIAGHLDDQAFQLGKIELEDWRLILKFDARGDVLELARHGWESVERLLSSLRASVHSMSSQNEALQI